VAGAFDLTGHVALVTGGTSGIGLGMASALAEAGADVCVWGRNEARNAEAAQRLAVHGTRVHAESVDVSDEAAVERAFAASLERFGRVDSCFANAAVPPLFTPFVEMGLSEFRRVTAVNLEGAFLTLRAAAAHMVQRGGGGSLVGVASLAVIEAQACGQHYAASKAGLCAMIRACASELARHRIRANTIVPGWIDTPMTSDMVADERYFERVQARIPARRWGTPADFGGLAVYLASPVSSYHSGDTLVVDGAYAVF
jgi:hypothetical protein